VPYQQRVTTDAQPQVRPLVPADIAAYSRVLARAFLADGTDDLLQEMTTALDPARALGAFDGDDIVGGTAILPRRITLPGETSVAVAAITDVAVAPDHRRRGVLTSLMRRQLDDLHEQGQEPIAALWASEAAIYARFGYGLAGFRARAEVLARSVFRADVPIAEGRVRELDLDTARPLLRELYARAWPHRIGALSRDDESAWDRILFDPPASRDGAGPDRFAVHPEGYAIFNTRSGWTSRGPDGVAKALEVVATSPGGYAAIWRYLLDLDLIGRVEAKLTEGEPLAHMLVTTRDAIRPMADGVWVRLVDLDRALPARRYTAPVDVVLAVTDPFCPWNTGRWRLRVDGAGAAEVTATDAPADLSMEVSVLAAVFLGGVSLATLAAAGRVAEHTPGALARTAATFLSPTPPALTEDF
jgi:predicted acetyltransferase